MARKNSNKDPAMLAAKQRTLDLMRELSEATMVALDEFIQSPRWCGLPGPDVGSYGKYRASQYPYDRQVLQHAHDAAFRPGAQRVGYDESDWLVMPTDEASAIRFHELQIDAFATMFSVGMPAYDHQYGTPRSQARVKDESPVVFMDRVRGSLRYAERTDERSLFTTTFALLECSKVGAPEEDRDAPVRTPGVLPKKQKYEYLPIARERYAAMTMLHQAQAALRAVFDHVSVALMPRDLSKAEESFLKWIHERGGEARSHEVVKWLDEMGLPSGGQDPSLPYVRKFCDKQGRAGTRTPWRVRPEALALIGVRP